MPQKPKPSPKSSPTPDPDSNPVSAASLAALAALGALAALWALFLWGELRVSRAGGAAFCGLGSSQDCAAVWDSAFAGTLHLTDFEGADGTISVDAQVACRLPGGSLRRAAELAGGPAPASSPGAAGSTLPPFDGAAPAERLPRRGTGWPACTS